MPPIARGAAPAACLLLALLLAAVHLGTDALPVAQQQQQQHAATAGGGATHQQQAGHTAQQQQHAAKKQAAASATGPQAAVAATQQLAAAKLASSSTAAPAAHPKQQQQQQQPDGSGSSGRPPGPAAAAAAADVRKRLLREEPRGAAPAPPPAPFVIPVPPPGTAVPVEAPMPLYSPDQLRLRLPYVLDDVALDSQVLSVGEQLAQAAALNVSLTPELLELAAPLLGRHGRLSLPARLRPSDWPAGYVALCAIVKDQAADLPEWLEYHRHIGVGKVYVYDNNSTVPLASSLAPFLHSGFVEYAFFSGMARYRDLFRTSSQWWAYNDCISRYAHRHRWLGFIDADEFIVLHDTSSSSSSAGASSSGGTNSSSSASGGGGGSTNSGSRSSASASNSSSGAAGALPGFLVPYERHGGLALNWLVFGSSGHKRRPRGGVLVNYHACLPGPQEQNGHVKVLANTAHLLTVGDDPHRVVYKTAGAATVNELGTPVPGAKSAVPSHTRIALYHYLTKSQGEYAAKMSRGSAAGNYKSPEFFTAINGLATDTCTAALPLGLECCPSVLRELGPDGVAAVRARHAALRQQAAAVAAAAGTAPGAP